MQGGLRWWLLGGVAASVLFGVSGLLLPHLAVYAPSASLQKGWYLRDFGDRDIAVGDVIVLHMPAGVMTAETIGGQPRRLLKQIAALPDDMVCWDAHAMTVVTHQGTVRYPYHPDKGGLRPPETCLAVLWGDVVVVGTHPRSFDSRYFGIVPWTLFQFRVKPLWTWEAA